jgi:hypothetical protein
MLEALAVRRPSPAMIVALLALFVALGGSSYAALKIGSPQIRNNSVLSADLHNNTVRGADVHRNTLTGDDIKESSLRKVPAARVADSALAAEPQAYALIDTYGLVDPPHSKGISNANVTHPRPGVYCFNGLRFPIKTVAATAQAGGSTLVEQFIVSARAKPDGPFDGPDRFDPTTGNVIPGPHFDANCPGTEQASVVVTNSYTQTRPDDQVSFFPGFYVVFN